MLVIRPGGLSRPARSRTSKMCECDANLRSRYEHVLFRGLAFGGTTAACSLWLAAGTLGRQANEALPHEIGGHDESRCGGVLCPGHEPIKREHCVRHAKEKRAGDGSA